MSNILDERGRDLIREVGMFSYEMYAVGIYDQIDY